MIERYTLPEMGRVWSEARKYELWCQVEVMVLEAHAAAGVVPESCVAPVRAAVPPTPEAVAEIEAVTQHDVIAFLSAWADNTSPREAAAYVHFGMTSSDLLDTALALQLVEATDLLLVRCDTLVAALRDLGLAHRDTVARRAYARDPRRADDVGAPGGRPRVRDGPLPRPAAGGPRLGGGRQDQRCRGDVLQHLARRRAGRRRAGWG